MFDSIFGGNAAGGGKGLGDMRRRTRSGLGLMDSFDMYDYAGGGGGGDLYANGGGGFDMGLFSDVGAQPSNGTAAATIGGGNGGASDLFMAYFDYYLGQGWDPEEAGNQAAIDAAAPAVQITTTAPAPPAPVDYTQAWPLETPTPIPLPPPLFPSTDQTTGTPQLPGYCPQGYYHPIGDPYSCVPFPPAPPAGGPGAKPGAPPSSGMPKPSPPQTPCVAPYTRNPFNGQCVPPCVKPQVRNPYTFQCVTGTPTTAAPQCPPGYWPNLTTRQCELIPQCPGTGVVFNQALGQCMPIGSTTTGGLLDSLKNIPTWVYLLIAAGFIVVTSQSGGRSRKGGA